MRKSLLRFGWGVGACLLLFATYAHGQNSLIYPLAGSSDTGGGVGCVPNWTWSDGACWYVVPTAPPVFRLPAAGDDTSVFIANSFILDISTPSLNSLNINAGNLLSGATFVQPNVTLTTASESVTGFVGYNQAGGTNSAGSFTLSGTYTLQLGTLSATSEGVGQVDFGDPNAGGLGNSPGVFNQSNGQNTVSGTLTLGANSFLNNGAYNLNGGQLSAQTIIVGDAGTGFFTQTGGINTVSDQLTIGSKAGSHDNFSGESSYTLSDGNLSAANVVVGDFGSGTFNQTGGRSTVTGQLSVGNQSGGGGEYDLRGTATLEAGTEIFGSGSSTYNQTGGTNTVDGDLSAAQNSVGLYTLSGNDPLLKVGGDENLGVADGSRITFVQSGGNNQVAGNLNLGGTPHQISSAPAGRGSYQMDGGLVSVDGSEVIAPNGDFQQAGGANTANHLVLQGTYELNGSGVLAATDEMIGRPLLLTGQATFTQRGGTHTIAGTLTLGDRGNYELIDGTLTASEIINTCSGLCSPTLLSQRGGFFDYVGGVLNANFNNEADGLLRISGRGARIVNGTLTNNGTVEVTADQVEFSNVILTAGVFQADPTAVEFQNLNVGAQAYITGAAGDTFQIKGDFINDSTQNTLWDTGTSLLDFTGGGTHTFDLAGQNGAGFSDNFAWGTLVIDPGNTLDLDIGSGDALYVDFLQGLIISGNTITNLDGAPGLFMYYNAADNPFVQGNYNLTGGGELIAFNGPAPQPTPEPSSLILLSSGLAAALLMCSFARKPAAAPR
jgi:hypothetical protein